MENIEKIFEILRSIPVTEKNRDEIHEIRQLLIKEKYIEALAKMKELQKSKLKSKTIVMKKMNIKTKKM